MHGFINLLQWFIGIVWTCLSDFYSSNLSSCLVNAIVIKGRPRAVDSRIFSFSEKLRLGKLCAELYYGFSDPFVHLSELLDYWWASTCLLRYVICENALWHPIEFANGQINGFSFVWCLKWLKKLCHLRNDKVHSGHSHFIMNRCLWVLVFLYLNRRN